MLYGRVKPKSSRSVALENLPYLIITWKSGKYFTSLEQRQESSADCTHLTIPTNDIPNYPSSLIKCLHPVIRQLINTEWTSILLTDVIALSTKWEVRSISMNYSIGWTCDDGLNLSIISYWVCCSVGISMTTKWH